MKKQNNFRRILCVILSCLFLASSFAAISVSAAETTTGTAAALGSNTITLDGVIDDAWENAPSQTLSLRHGTSNDSVTFKMLWDNKHLYILVDITDNTDHTTNEKWWNNDAIEVVVNAGGASTTMLQKKLKLGYARASRVMDQLEEKGIVGPSEGAKPRTVLISKQQWYEMQALGDGAGVPDIDDVFADDDDFAGSDDDFV